MTQVSLFRIYLLRALYLFMVIGLAFHVWPGILHHRLSLPLMTGVGWSMLGAVSILALVGLRYPLQLLPILFFEVIWKTIWLLTFALPLWWAGQMDAETAQSVFECVLEVIILIAMPWRYAFEHYVVRRGDRWTNSQRTGTA